MNEKPPLRRLFVHRTVLVELALALVLGQGCGVVRYVAGEKPEDGVAVKALTANLAFGAEQERAGLPGVAPLSQLGPVGEVFLLREPDFGPIDEEAAPVPRSPVTSPPRSACPDPDQSAISTEEATQLPKGTVRAGTYRWKVDGTFELPGVAKFALPKLALRTITAVATNAGVTSYDYRITSLAGSEIQSIEVRADGVYLTRLQIIGGNQTIDFTPLPALAPKLYSLPVRAGEAIAAQVPDVVHGLLFTLTGQVGGRERLEGCGTVFDGWAFRGTRVLEAIGDSARSIRSTDYQTWLAPQYGGVFVGEKASTQGQFGPLVYRTDYTATLGDERPIA